ncbi:MAG: tetratricopeptide repeat protein [Armatimonadetes bacterium]|nr:tetratricopeptide repeat protein [Armatimonadota bacterium]
MRRVGRWPGNAVLSEPPTFLFTDIAGSTRLWQEHPAAMHDALARHDELLGRAVADGGGRVVKHTGDGILAIFPHPGAALAAAVAAQVALRQQAEPGIGRLPVRMALHCGEARERDGDYFGPALNRCARLLGAAHPDQILLSEPLAHAVDGATGFELADLGVHALRDLDEPERVFQVRHPELPGHFPPLRGIESYRHNLPAQLTRLVGRTAELAAAEALFEHTRLLTLVGGTGIGKTRLAIALAADLLDRFPAGAWLVALVGLAGPIRVLTAIAHTLGVRDEPGRTTHESLVAYLQGKRLLLLLDNCEHVVADVAGVVHTLLRACSELHILATSQEALQVVGEATYPEPPLSLPTEGAALDLEAFAAVPAVDLFVERARAVNPEFRLTAQNGAVVADICRRLDGVPLSIELAAARVRMMAPEQILARLDDSFKLLAGGSRTAPERHRSLRAAVEWSYGLLDPVERELFDRLAVFPADFGLEAAERVAAPDGASAWEVTDRLGSLVAKSLLQAVDAGQERRFRMLSSLRAFGREHLHARDGWRSLREAHVAWCLELAEATEPRLKGADQVAALARLDAERAHFQAALETAREATSAEPAHRLIAALWRWWYLHGRLLEGRSWCEAAAARSDGSPPLLRALALNAAGVLAGVLRDLPVARAHHEEALAIRREHGGPEDVAGSLNNLGMVLAAARDTVGARAAFAECVEFYRQAPEAPELGIALSNLGSAAMEQGDLDAARAAYEASLEHACEHGSLSTRAAIEYNLGELHLRRQDEAEAVYWFRSSLARQREVGNPRGMARSLQAIAWSALQQGDVCGAYLMWQGAQRLFAGAGALPRMDDERRLREREAELKERVRAAGMDPSRLELPPGWEWAVEMALEGAAPGAAPDHQPGREDGDSAEP